MIFSGANLGFDWEAAGKSLVSAGGDLLTKELPDALTKTVQTKAQAVATPYVQQLVQNKASAAVSKGNVALWAGVGGGAGLLIGALLAGGSWQRRATGGGVLGAVLAGAGAFAGLKIGLLRDSA